MAYNVNEKNHLISRAIMDIFCIKSTIKHNFFFGYSPLILVEFGKDC